MKAQPGRSRVRARDRTAIIGCLRVLLAFCFGDGVEAQNWIQTTAPPTNWVGLACSADGSKLVAVARGVDGNPGPMFSSTDTGVTWHRTSAPVAAWLAIASSADGERLIATADNSAGSPATWISTNAGTSWVACDFPAGAHWVASSADGMKLVAAGQSALPGNYVATSQDGGMTWSTNTIPLGLIMQGLAASDDGTKVAALAIDKTSYFFWLFASTNSGATWDQNGGPDLSDNYGSLACSADGSRLVAPVLVAGVFISPDWGQSWQMPNSIQGTRVALSADGTKLILTDGAFLYRSTDSGVSWLKTDAPQAGWQVLATSADGTKLVAAVGGNGGIYTWSASVATQLEISLTQGGVILSGNVSGTASVEQSPQLAAPVWSAITTTPTQTNGQFQWILAATNKSCFYRLKSPPP